MNQKERRIFTESIDLQYFIKIFSNHWPLLGGCLMFALLIAFGVNSCSHPAYEVSSTIVINEGTDEFTQTSASLLSDIGIFASDKNFANELQAIQSTPIIDEAIKKINFSISYYQHNKLSKIELYKSSPFIVIINPDHSQLIDLRFNIEIKSNSTFHLSCKEKDITLYNFKSNRIIEVIPSISEKQDLSFGDEIKNEYFDFKVLLNSSFNFNPKESVSYSFIMHRPKDIVKAYQAALKVKVPDRESTVAELTIESKVPEKAIDFLSSLTETYLQKDVERKNHISIKTIEYIDGQLNIVKDSLQIAEHNLQQFRSSHQVIDLTLQANQIYDELRELENEKAELSVNLKYYEYIEEYFSANQDYSDLITPAGMGIEDPLLNNLIEELIGLNAEKVSLVENNQTKSPYLRKIDIRIDNLKNMIGENISYVGKTALIAINDLNSRIAQLNAEINKLPGKERALFGMQRQFNLNDAIYTYLLEKRSEAEIAKASYQPDAELLEPADIIGDKPISPNKKINYLIAFILGISLPVSFVRLKEYSRKCFTNKDDILHNIDLPVFGQIYHNNKKVETVVNTFPKSHVAESFRRMRSNSNYFLSQQQHKVITITSTISQEGKSFVSSNLAISYAFTGSKTILIGFDLRKPKLFERLEIKEQAGVSDYLSKQAELNDVIQNTKIDNLDVIWAGEEPPNPAELIASSRTNDLIMALKSKYEFIIIDTAPVGILSDGMMLLNYADMKAFVIRLNYTPKKEALSILDDLAMQNTAKLALIINDMPVRKKTRYGYGYYEMENPKQLRWTKRI